MHFRTHANSRCNVLAVALLFGTFLISRSNGNEPLRWKFQKNERVAIEVDQNSVIQESSRSETKMRQRSSLEWTVVDVDQDGTATIEHKTQRVRLSVSDSQDELNADSDTTEASVLHPKIKGIWLIAVAPMNSTFRFRLSSLGEIVDVESSQPTETRNSPKVAVTFPKADPKIGEPWTIQSSLQQERIKLLLTSSYQLIGKEVVDGRELSKIKMSTAFQLDPSSNAKLVSQNALGVIWFDPVHGKVTHSESHQEIGIELDHQGSPSKQSIQQSTEISYRLESARR